MREVAERFTVSCTWVNELVQRQKRTGSIAVKPHGGGAKPKLTAEHYPILEEIIVAQNDATLGEIRKRLDEETGLLVSQPTICRALAKIKLTRKKKPVMQTNKNLKQ